MSNHNYDWVSFYEEFADKLLKYKDNREELIKKIYRIYEIAEIKMPTMERRIDGSTDLIDMDPFTVFAMFNKQITDENRKKLCNAIKSEFSVSSSIPTNFDGIPLANNQKATFYWFEGGRGEYDIDNLWDVFDKAICYASEPNNETYIGGLSETFDKALRQKGVKWNLTMGLYWIRPNAFINLDSRNRWFIAHDDNLSESLRDYIKKMKEVPHGFAYIHLCLDIKREIELENCPYDSFPDLSYNAWLVSKQDDEYEKNSEKEIPELSAKFLRWCRPILEALKELGGEAKPREVRENIIKNERLSEEETSQLRPNSNMRLFDNDVSWARYYLDRAGYVIKGNRGNWTLTESGWKIDLTDEEVDAIYRRIAEENKKARNDKGAALADEDVDTKRYWLYAPGHGASRWDEFYSKGIIAIGWGEIGDLSAFNSKNEMKEAMKASYDETRPYRNDAHATWQFAFEMKPGDVVFAKRGRDTIIGRGVIESDYIYDESIDDNYFHTRKVKWTDNGEWEHPGQAAMKTLTDITSYTEYVEQLNSLFETEDEEIQEEETPLNIYEKSNFLSEVYISEESYDTLVGLLKKKKNVILQGAPGVGKTYAAKRLAYSMMGVKDPDRVQLVQFHQSFTYEDFIEGFRPSSTGLNFEIKKGSFYNFCKKAADDKENDYFFIIDEINRGNISKIFGELFMLIEADKRGNDIQLLYSSDKFSVPKNVYIIGMMNTADRSLAIIDYALRRRFAFFEMKPAFEESERFKEYQYSLGNEKFNKLIDCIIALNRKISEDDSLGEGFCIGHSYFCDLEEIDNHTLSNIVEFEIIPLLKEYWFDESSKVNEWSERLRSAVK